MNEIDGVKELLEQRFHYIEQVMNERQVAINMALELGAKEQQRRLEYIERIMDERKNEADRRLSELNGEAGRLQAMQVTYLPREIHAQHYEQIMGNLNELSKNQANQTGRDQVLSVVVSATVSIIVGLLVIVGSRFIH